MDEYPSYLLYASQAEIQANLHSPRKKEYRDILKRTEEIRIVEHEGKLCAAIDLDIYHYLLDHLMKHPPRHQR